MNATIRATFDGSRGEFARANPGRDPLTPPAQGLYNPSNEHDSCGVGFVADMKIANRTISSKRACKFS